jgi:acetolactate synthase-1/2/3 large subunit
MRVSEYVAKFLVDQGVRQVFMLTGGGAMFLNDALAYQPGLSVTYCHHEQACAMAAEGYARVTGRPAVVCVTTGPGAINALNGVFGAFTDSIPMIVISGQVKRSTHLRATPIKGLRQLGDQEVDIVAMAAPICKKVFPLFDPAQAAAMLDEAFKLCEDGRPGPVWIDIPIDVQSATICGEGERAPAKRDAAISVNLGDQIRDIAEQVARARRPLLLFGTGVRLSGTQAQLIAAAELLDVPVSTGWTHDTIESDHRLFAGRAGTIGTRWGNFVLQSCDLLVVLGSRLNVRQTSYNFESFAKNAKIIQIDVDDAEFRKATVRIDQTLHCTLQYFAPAFLNAARSFSGPPFTHKSWLEWIADRRKRFPVIHEAQRNVLEDGRINPYYFLEELFARTREGDIIVTGNASACIIPFQIASIKKEMRLFSNSGSASMGYDLPAAVGAAIAAPERRVICIAGDGSAQLNIQELQTVRHYGLNLVIVILSNDGYLSIRTSQNNFFKRRAGESSQSGVTFPSYYKVANAYGIKSYLIEGRNFQQNLDLCLREPGPILIEAMLDGSQGFEPRMSSRQLDDGTIVSPSLEDMHPFLSEAELRDAMDFSGV